VYRALKHLILRFGSDENLGGLASLADRIFDWNTNGIQKISGGDSRIESPPEIINDHLADGGLPSSTAAGFYYFFALGAEPGSV
jgi:hypothetical protein